MLRHHVIGLLVLLTAGSIVKADDAAEEWIKFFAGKWERTREFEEEGKETVIESARWSGRLAADGKAVAYTGKWDNGTKWVGFAGTVPGNFHFERGVSSAGITWSTDYIEVKPGTLKGTMTGKVDGKNVEGEITLTRTGDDSYKVEWKSENEDGLVVGATATNTRIKAKPKKEKKEKE